MCKATQLEHIRFHDRASNAPHEAPHKQKSLSLGNISRLLKIMHRLEPMPIFQRSHR